jgi:hypothetical protein
MRAAAIARALGGDGQALNGWLSCTCPVCRTEGKLGIKDADAGLAVNCFKLCRRADILAEIERLGLDIGAPSEPEDPEKTARRRALKELARRKRIAAARDFIGECLPWNATGQIARYFSGRDIDPRLLSTSIMWHGLARHPEGGQRPLMVGVIEHVDFGIIGATRTFLALDGSQKAAFRKPRLFLGLAGGGAVRLGRPDPDPNREIVVGEGLESTLSYMQLHGLPTGYAALSATGIAALVLPPEARRVVIAADNDQSGVGLKGGSVAARRWCGEMRRVRIDMPQDAGTDWNDVLVGRAMVPA